jgi:hypothetical protein
MVQDRGEELLPGVQLLPTHPGLLADKTEDTAQIIEIELFPFADILDQSMPGSLLLPTPLYPKTHDKGIRRPAASTARLLVTFQQFSRAWFGGII